MHRIEVITSDGITWNKIEVISEFVECLFKFEHVELDLCNEGPDLYELDIFAHLTTLIKKFNYREKISLKTKNILQKEIPGFEIAKSFPKHLLVTTCKNLCAIEPKKQIQFKFGNFIGRSNHHRLDLGSFLYTNYKNDTLQTFHYDKNHEFHRKNLGLELLIEQTASNDYNALVDFIASLPIKIQEENFDYPILGDNNYKCYPLYNDFFVEVVCETYFSGQTFFPTEKIWRPIMLETPFIVQGPQNYLDNLRKLGFKTFDKWWDEGYQEDPADHQPKEIKKVIDSISKLDNNKIQHMYNDMHPILEHNKNRLLELYKNPIQLNFIYE